MNTPRHRPTAAERGRLATLVALLLPAGLLTACASTDRKSQQRQVASLLAFLHPGAEPPTAQPEVQTVLNVPFRIGIAFVPDDANAMFRLPEAERQRLAERVRAAFRDYPFIRDIELVPSSFLSRRGGFDNLDRVAALLRLDVVLLVSFDQVQHAGANRWSFLYWTGLGAYVVEGDQYDILTALEVSVFDVKSRRLLMHAGGRPTVKGEATWVGFAERSRAARTASFEKAFDDMTKALQREVAALSRARAARPVDPPRAAAGLQPRHAAALRRGSAARTQRRGPPEPKPPGRDEPPGRPPPAPPPGPRPPWPCPPPGRPPLRAGAAARGAGAWAPGRCGAPPPPGRPPRPPSRPPPPPPPPRRVPPTPIVMRPSTMGSARSSAGASKPGTPSRGMLRLMSFSMSRRKISSSRHTRLMASPIAPARPVRPMRCT